MSELLFRILFVVRFILFMAVVYMVLHVLVASRIRKRDSKVRAFFTILTSPLTRPVRAFLPRETSEQQVRVVTLGVLFVLWLSLALLTAMGGARLS